MSTVSVEERVGAMAAQRGREAVLNDSWTSAYATAYTQAQKVAYLKYRLPKLLIRNSK